MTWKIGKLRGSEELKDSEKGWWKDVKAQILEVYETEEVAIQHGVMCHGGQLASNRLQCPLLEQYFQFGDIRIELESKIIVIEIEGQGCGLTNLLKYLPYLEQIPPADQRLRKPLILFHLWGKSYPTHKFLYDLVRNKLFDGRFAGLFDLRRPNEPFDRQKVLEEIRKQLPLP